jgi:hypothetical protein
MCEGVHGVVAAIVGKGTDLEGKCQG